MMKNRKRMTILAFMLLLIGGIGTAVTYASYDPVDVLETAENEGDGISSIDIRADNEKLIVLPTSEEFFRAELQGRGKGQDKDKLSMEEQGGNLVITTGKQRGPIFSFNFLKRDLRLTVYVPEKVYEQLKVDIDNGGFEVHDIQAERIIASTGNGKVTMRDVSSDSMDISTNNGRVDLEGITSSQLVAHSNNGKVIMNEVDSDSLQLTTNNGRIELKEVEGQIRGKTSNGGISLKTDHLDRELDLETNNGSIEIQTDSEPANAILDIRTDNGKVTVFNQDNWNSVIGDGENHIRLNTDNGSIDIRK